MLKLPWRASFAGVAAALLAAMGAASACTSFGGSENGADAAAEGAPAEGAPADGSGGPDAVGTAPDASGDAGAPPLLNDTFATGCDAWLNSGASQLSPSQAGHDSPGSCRICKSSLAGVPLARKEVPAAPGGATYTISAWVQAGGDANAVTADVGFQLYNADGSDFRSGSAEVTVGDGWARVAKPFEVAGAARVFATIALLKGSVGQCFDFDDVVVQR